MNVFFLSCLLFLILMSISIAQALEGQEEEEKNTVKLWKSKLQKSKRRLKFMK